MTAEKTSPGSGHGMGFHPGPGDLGCAEGVAVYRLFMPGPPGKRTDGTGVATVVLAATVESVDFPLLAIIVGAFAAGPVAFLAHGHDGDAHADRAEGYHQAEKQHRDP